MFSDGFGHSLCRLHRECPKTDIICVIQEMKRGGESRKGRTAIKRSYRKILRRTRIRGVVWLLSRCLDSERDLAQKTVAGCKPHRLKGRGLSIKHGQAAGGPRSPVLSCACEIALYLVEHARILWHVVGVHLLCEPGLEKHPCRPIVATIRRSE